MCWVAASISFCNIFFSYLSSYPYPLVHSGPLARLADTLRRVARGVRGGDLERGLTRCLHRSASPLELVAVLTTLQQVGLAGWGWAASFVLGGAAAGTALQGVGGGPRGVWLGTCCV